MSCRGHGIDPWRLEGYFRCVIDRSNVTASDCEKWTYDELYYSGWLTIGASCSYGVWIEALGVTCMFTSACCLGTGHACPSEYIPNRPPRVWDSREIVDEDSELTINLSRYAEDPDGEPIIAYWITQHPQHDRFWNFNGNTGKVQYIPEENWNSSCWRGGGNDSFKFKAQDERGAWSEREARISIHVNPVNDPPDAKDQGPLSVEEDTQAWIRLEADDPDITCEGDKLTITSDEKSAQGGIVERLKVRFKLGWLLTDDVIYTPPKDYNGDDHFSFTATDEKGESDIAIVSITVTPINDPPTAQDDSARDAS